MGKYEKISCPHCRHVLQFWEQAYAREKIGPPALLCPRCKKPVATGMKFWTDMSREEQFECNVASALTSLASGIFYGIVVPILATWFVMAALDRSKQFENLLYEYWVWVVTLPSPLAMYVMARSWRSHQKRKLLCSEMYSGTEWTEDFSVYSEIK